MPLLVCTEISKSFLTEGRATQVVLNGVSLSVDEGETVAVVGKSGSGKSTWLRILGGLLQPDCGEVRLDGKLLNEPTPDVGIVFQKYTVFPWMSVQGNVEAGLLHRNLIAVRRRELARQYLTLVGLIDVANRRPDTLSGGMQQRVALARTYAMDPRVLLMDEPFGALDAITRQEMQRELLKINEREKKTVIFVTHDIAEAITLAGRIVVLAANRGHVQATFVRDRHLNRSELHEAIARALEGLADGTTKDTYA